MTAKIRQAGKTGMEVFLKGHIWLGLCAVTCTAATYILLHQTIQPLYIFFVFFGTMTIYNLHSLYSKKDTALPDMKSGGIPARFQKFFLPAGLFTTAGLYAILTPQNKMILLIPAILAVLYVLPVFHGKRLKDFPYVKIAVIALVWTTVTFGVPVWHIPRWWSEQAYSMLFLDRFVFIFALAIPFDIRDIRFDTGQNLRTLPNTIGVPFSRILALFLLGIGILLFTGAIGQVFPRPHLAVWVAGVYAVLAYLIFRVRQDHSDFYYIVLLDGILFLYGITVILAAGWK